MTKRKLAALMAATRKHSAKLGAALLIASAGVESAMAADPVSAQAALTDLSANSTGYGPVMWGLALAAVGVLVGVKWIKRGRGAA